MEVKVKEIVKYKGHTVKQNGSVDLKLTAMYSELTKSMQVLQMLNNDVELTAKLPSMKPIKLGVFRVSKVIIDGDGESVLCFNSLNDYVEMNNVNSIVCNEEFQILMRAEIEEEENEEEE
ncbi:MAG: hypothetical protein J6D28_02515 [Bacilli bacterium]|nr:hypothetical protein [Bacilli bacterium]